MFALWVAVLCAVLAVAGAQDSVRGTPVGPNGMQRLFSGALARAAPTYKADCLSKAVGLFCKDCRTAILCDGSDTPVGEFPCADLTDKQNAYCTDNACALSKNPEDTACSTSTTFKCTAEGFFPDAAECTIYHQCVAASGGAGGFTLLSTYDCPPGYVYDALKPGYCMRKLQNSDCSRFDCAQTTNNFVLYPRNANYYAFCKEDATTNVKTTTVYRCSTAPYGAFQTATKTCMFNCTAAGNFPDSRCGYYYTCYLDAANKLISLAKKCSGKVAFNKETQLCDAVIPACP